MKTLEDLQGVFDPNVSPELTYDTNRVEAAIDHRTSELTRQAKVGDLLVFQDGVYFLNKNESGEAVFIPAPYAFRVEKVMRGVQVQEYKFSHYEEV